MSEVASAYVSLIPSFKGGAASIIRQTDSAATSAGKSFSKRFSGTVKGMLGGALAGIGVTKLLSDSIGEAREAQKVGALTEQVIKSTGGAARVSAKHVGDLATALSNKVGVDDEAIQSGENMLLTFKNIRNEAGKGNKIFDQAARTTTDLAAAMAAASGGELNMRSASIQMGKALNDPVKGITALSRVGVTFTDGQKAQIKTLVESGNVMGAQKIILRELKSEFGGAAAAQATAGDKAKVAWKNLEEQIGTALLPVVDDLANRLTKDVVPAVSKFITQMQDGTGKGGEFVHVLKDTVGVGKDILGFFNGLPGPVKKYGAELLIAAVALNKVNNLARGLASSLTPAEAGMTRTARASYALGVGLRNLAGAGGMIAVADGAKRSGSAVGYLETTLGGAAAGFAVGGPVGAAIGGVAGGLFSIAKEAMDAGGAIKDTLPAWNQYADTLNGVGAATSRATREMVLERLTKSGLLKETQALNISDRDAVQAAMGNQAARKRVSAALADATAKGKNYQALQVANKLGAETTAINSSRVAQLKKNLALAGTAAEAKRIQDKLDKLGRTNANPRISLNAGDTVSKLNTIQGMIRDLTGKSHVVSIKGHVTGGLGNLLGAGGNRTVDPLADPTASGYRTGQSLIVGLMRGIDTKKGGLKKRISQLSDMIQQLDDQVSSLSDTRSGFLSTFSSDNLFGASVGPKGVGSLIAFEQKQAQQATQLMADVQAVIGMGLSKSLVTQLQSQGTSGAAALHAIATGGAGNIATLNALDAQTQAALQAAGMKAGNFVRGGNIDADLAAAQRREELLKQILDTLQKKEHKIEIHDKSGNPKKTAREVSRRQKWAGAR